MQTIPIYSGNLIKRIFSSGAIGNLVETYDLILLTLLAPILSKTFFSASSYSSYHIINILYIFLLGLLVRPIGNILLGIVADKVGRKKIMITSIVFTGLGTSLISIIPSYKLIGPISLFIFVLLRIVQNFFASIEYISSAAYLIECADKKNLGFYGSFAAIGISGGYLLASLMVFIVTYLTNKNIIPDWSWRFLFALAFIGMSFGLWLRYQIPESIDFILKRNSKNNSNNWLILRNCFIFIKNDPIKCLSISAFTWLGVCVTYIFYIYVPINMITMERFTSLAAYSINIFSLLLIVILIPLAGKLSDYYDRIVLLKLSAFFIIIFAWPFFWYSIHGSFMQTLLSSMLFSIPAAFIFSLYPVVITESFPVDIRCTTAAIIYQCVVCIEMGILPLISHYLILKTHILYTPFFLLMFSAMIGFCGLYKLSNKN